MAPDYISEIALITTSIWQRKAFMSFRRNLNDTIETCWEDGEFLEIYLIGDVPAHYPLPVPMREAEMATNYYWLNGHCPEPDGPCMACIENFTEGIEYLHLS